LVNDFAKNDIDIALKAVKNGKAAEADGILPEFIKNLGPKGKTWLAKLSTDVANTCVIPKFWKEVKVIAILKPGKPANDARNYRPISLLSTVYKRFERLLLQRLQPAIEKELPIEQVGFRKDRNCCDQVLALTTYVENGFQCKKKSGAVFLNLSSAYDTVWKRRLLLKMVKIVKCRKTLRLLESMLSNRKFKVFLNGEASKYRYLKNGLPQGSVLSPVLFNVYTADIVGTTARKFIYADDIALVAQADSLDTVESMLNRDLYNLHQYFNKWYLTLNRIRR
jgi:hypothetical protein